MIGKYISVILTFFLLNTLTLLYVFLLFNYKFGDFSGFSFFYYLFDAMSFKFWLALIVFLLINLFVLLKLYRKIFLIIISLFFVILILWKQDVFIKLYNGYKAYQTFNKVLKEKVILKQNKIEVFNCNKNQLIAHAGGQIEGNIYTNSLEALNNAYKNGIRYFELDIRLSYDGYLIAMHEFEQWKIFTGYSKNRMPTLQEFMRYKILKKYTPLDIKAINNWFKIHKDAILVTDKINNPILFIQNFSFKDRLIMELFSIESVLEAKNLGINAMPSENLIALLKDKGVKFFKNIGIKNIVTAYNFTNKNLLKKYLSYGIKVYIYGNYKKIICDNYYFGRYINQTNIKYNKMCEVEHCIKN